MYALLTGGVMWLLARQVPAARLIGSPWNYFGWGVLSLGLGVDLYSVILFLRARTSVNPMQLHRANRLVVTGIYRISRNPMYLGLVLALSGWALMLGSPILLLLVWVFARALAVLQIVPEEDALRAMFGDIYVEYEMKVNRWIGRQYDVHPRRF